jgi:sulfur-oxidizing protein SoxZ
MSRARLRLPPSARAGESVEIRTLIDHPMETGLRRDASGRLVARNMLTRFEARANGEVVFAADFANGTSANPTLTFHVRVAGETLIETVWISEAGQRFAASGSIARG